MTRSGLAASNTRSGIGSEAPSHPATKARMVRPSEGNAC